LELVGTNAVRLDMPAHLSQIHPVVSVQLVKPYHARDNKQSLPPIIINDEPEYEVESIIDFNLLPCDLPKGYFSTTIDEATRYATVDILSKKSDAGGSVARLIAYYETQTDLKVQRVRTD
jgi:hypothetical protein